MTAQTNTAAIDPVCGMTVDMESARADGLTTEYEGRTYGFCSKGCLLEFRESPESYAENLSEHSPE